LASTNDENLATDYRAQVHTGDMQHGAHIHRTTSLMRIRSVPRHKYASKFVPASDDVDPILEHSLTASESVIKLIEEADQGNQPPTARMVSKNWITRGAGMCPYPAKSVHKD
jgi:hypothetical protein